MNARRLTTSIAALFALSAPACVIHRGASAPAPDVQGVALEVENRNWSDIVVYVVHDGTTTRFMSITTARTETVALAPRFIGTDGIVRFIAHRIGGQDDYYSPNISVRTGATIALTLQPELNMSSVGVW